MCSVFMFPYLWLWSLLFFLTTDGYGIFNTHTNLGVCRTHESGGQAQTSLHKSWFWGIENLSITLPCQGIEPRVFPDLNLDTNHWATYTPLPPPHGVDVGCMWVTVMARYKWHVEGDGKERKSAALQWLCRKTNKKTFEPASLFNTGKPLEKMWDDWVT